MNLSRIVHATFSKINGGGSEEFPLQLSTSLSILHVPLALDL